MSIKGYSTQKKVTKKIGTYSEELTADSNQFVTAQKTSSNKLGLDTVSNGLYRTTVLAKAAEVGSVDPKRVLISTAHGAKAGDVVRFETTAANPGFESGILSIPNANTIILAAELDADIIPVTDEFFILRYVVPRLDETGASITTSGPVQFIQDAAVVSVTQDTVVPANSIPLPVINLNPNGTEVDPSTATLQTANNVLVGAVNETAPASDTADSGLNGRLQRIAQRLTSLIGLFPATIGQKANAASLAVTLSTEQDAQIGALTETAPATDTASSGLNGRLQRIAQRITSLIALLPASLGQKASAASLAVSLSTEQEGLIGALTETAPATDTASSGLNGRLQRIAQRITSLIALLPTALGQGTMAQSFKVVVASDQSAIPTSVSGKAIANAPIRNDYSSVNVTTGAYVQLIASTTSATSEIEIFDSSGQTLKIAVGAAASEVDQILVFPGGNSRVPLLIPAGTRVSIRAVSATASVGEICINLYA